MYTLYIEPTNMFSAMCLVPYILFTWKIDTFWFINFFQQSIFDYEVHLFQFNQLVCKDRKLEAIHHARKHLSKIDQNNAQLKDYLTGAMGRLALPVDDCKVSLESASQHFHVELNLYFLRKENRENHTVITTNHDLLVFVKSFRAFYVAMPMVKIRYWRCVRF